MTLFDEASRAEQISDAFTKYRNHNPDHVQHINETIAELVGLSCALREIDKLLEEYGGNLFLIEDDLKLVHDRVYETLAEMWRIIGSIGGKPDSPLSPEDFQRNWRKISRFGGKGGIPDLCGRLRTFKCFILVQCKTLKSKDHDVREYRGLRQDVREILTTPPRKMLEDEKTQEATDKALATPAANGLAKRPSYERQRDNAPLSPVGSGSSPPPFARNTIPSPPMSPADTYSTLSQVSSVDHEIRHWAAQVFENVPSYTPLPASNEPSRFHDDPTQPRHHLPGETYEEAVAMSFQPSPPGLRVGFWYRRRDWRSKLVAQWKDYRGRAVQVCLPLNILIVHRVGPMLHLCGSRDDDTTKVIWISMHFTTIERLILFGCTFLSMRALDGKKSTNPTFDWEFAGEEIEFAGKIRDNGFKHALRILRDKASKAIRLQASVRDGKLENTPVWTAFITHCITSRTWCQRLDKDTVCLRELRPHKFSSDFELQRHQNGAFVLTFENRQDAYSFETRIEELGREYRRARY